MTPTLIRHLKLTGLALLLAAVMSAPAGCSTKNLSYVGRTATQNDNIALQAGGPHQGQWKSDDLMVDYTYSNQADGLQIDGTVELTRRLTNTFQVVTNFSVQANLMDEEKKILASVPIVLAGNTPIRTWHFSQKLPAPAGARAMNFSYSGSASEGGGVGRLRDRDQVNTTFWKEP